jgi:hypothetical protein
MKSKGIKNDLSFKMEQLLYESVNRDKEKEKKRKKEQVKIRLIKCVFPCVAVKVMSNGKSWKRHEKKT